MLQRYDKHGHRYRTENDHVLLQVIAIVTHLAHQVVHTAVAQLPSCTREIDLLALLLHHLLEVLTRLLTILKVVHVIFL
jgi:hypothetical protein